MVAQCSTCFFGRIVPADGSLQFPVPPGSLSCQRKAPVAVPVTIGAGIAPWLWPVVKDDYWCGDYAATDPGVYQNQSQALWQAWTPTFTPSIGAFATIATSGYFIKIGSVCFFQARLDITAVGTAAGELKCTTPLTPLNPTMYGIFSGRVAVISTGMPASGAVITFDTIGGLMSIWNIALAFPGADDRAITAGGFYEVAL